MKKYLFSTLLLSTLTGMSSYAQNETTIPKPKGKLYLTTNFDSYLLSTSMLTNDRIDNKFTTPRFTVFPHLGFNANYDFSSKVGIQFGLSLKNLGFIEKYNNPDSTVIRRTYNVGIPVALKFGNLEGNNTYFFVGGGVDVPIHYKEKGFIKRNNKTKTNEWFSDRTEKVLPYMFVGARFNPGVVVKLQYYPTNYMNQDYTQVEMTNAGLMEVQPYKNYKVSTVLLTLGFDIKYTPKY